MEVLGYNIPLWIPIILILLYGYIKYNTWHFGVFKALGIDGPAPYPVIGNLAALMKKGLLGFDQEMFQKYGKVVGTFQGREPLMLIADPDMLKQILVKEFDSFRNHFALDLDDPPLTTMLSVLKDDQWRHVRVLLTPTFSGGKLKMMTQHINNATSLLVKNLEEKADSGEAFEFKEFCGAFTMDVIASTAFGIQVNSQVDTNSEFVRMAKKVFEFSLKNPRMILFFFFPFLIKPLTKYRLFSMFPSDTMNFFVGMTKQAMEAKTKSGIKQPDFLQLMMNAHEDNTEAEDLDEEADQEYIKDKTVHTQRKGLTNDEMYGQAIIFILAGYETTAATLSFFGYNMATNPECQERLHSDIEEAMQGNTEVNYNLAKNIPYLDWCLSESLRLFPPAPRTDRVADKDITINGVFIPKDMQIGIAIMALHLDPTHWPEPEKFKPERFSPEEVEARHPYVYLPFGLGPRSCIGMRLALLELKVAIIHLIRNFKFLTCEKTQIPLKLEKLQMKAEGGIMIKLEKRQ